MVQVSHKTINSRRVLALPERNLLANISIVKSSKNRCHKENTANYRVKFVTVINNIAESQLIALALPELRCTFDGRSIIPDVAVFTWNRIPLDEDGDIANVFSSYPDCTVEILSPDQNQTKVVNNILHCLNAGCQMGWLVDPDEKSVIAYPNGKQPIFFQEPEHLLPTPEFIGDFQLSIGELFSWLKPGNI